MLEYWNGLESFDKVLIVTLVVGTLVLLLCIYKIVQWFKRDEVVRRMEMLRRERAAHGLYPLYQKLGRWRLVNAIAFTAAIIVADGLLLRYARGAVIPISLVGIVGMYIVNNALVSARWRCAQCHDPLPRILGRSSLRPKLVDSCPHCGYVWNKGPGDKA